MAVTFKQKTLCITPSEVTEGAGVTVHRSIGSPALKNYDPFLMLDHFNNNNPDDYIAGFPSHPHRGFITFTYMLDGHMKHEDNMGNESDLLAGSAQWMKAASGVIHSEMPMQDNGLMQGFQLWINLPAKNKMDVPEYYQYHPDSFPVLKTNNYKIKVLLGNFGQARSPIDNGAADTLYFDVTVEPGKSFNAHLPKQNNSFLYIFEGSGDVNGQTIQHNALLTLASEAEKVNFMAGKSGARFLLISGTPINETIVQYGPFVMNTTQQIQNAILDYQSNTFIRHDAKHFGETV